MSGPDWREWAGRLERVLDALDWELLGEVYCDFGGVGFWQERRPAVVRLGREWAAAALRRLPVEGRSLYVGAGVAELPALLAEALLTRRQVTAVNLRARECDALDAGLRAAGLGDRLQLRCEDGATVAAASPGVFDHLGCVSLFSDPETFPLCSAVGYGRISPVQLDVEAFAAERERARVLAAGLWQGLRVPGWITTTAEEVAWFLEQGAAAGVGIEADDDLVESAVVGDPIGFLRVARE